VPQPKDPLRNFRNFLFYCWKHLNLPAPTRRQYGIAIMLSVMVRKGLSSEDIDRVMIQGFRGIAKSWITAVLCAWILYTQIHENPQLNILVVSAGKDRAQNFTTFLLRLITEIPELRFLIPHDDQRRSKSGFDVGPAQPTQTPSVVSLGITGQLTGNRADYIIADDVEVKQNSATVTMREKLKSAIVEFADLLKPGGRIIFLGTPQSEESIYNDLPKKGYKVIKWPARYPTKQWIELYGSTLAPDMLEDLQQDPLLAGKPSEPTRFDEVELRKRELEHGRAGFALQYMLDTSLSDAELYPLRLRDLMVMPLTVDGAPERCQYVGTDEYVLGQLEVVGFAGDRYHRPWLDKDLKFLPFNAVVMAIDPAGRGADETGWAVVGVLNSTLFLLDAGGARGYEDDTLKFLAAKAKEWKVNLIIHEPNFGDGMFAKVFTPFLKSIYPCLLQESERSNAQKEKRICDVLEPLFAGHRFVVNQRLVESDLKSTNHYPAEKALTYQLFYQLTHITREKGCLAHDDRADAVALAAGYFAAAMARSADEAAKAASDKRWEAEMKAHAKYAFKGLGDDKRKSPRARKRNWINSSQ
jgi:hypothetical protein